MASFIAHPSVRVKGTEHSYIPVLCQDEKCDARAKGSHMHCPFCSISEDFQDQVILQAHYRVKHVDKSIEFAGLKVLRCCNHCEIVGTIKGEKKFKGAHWHCYRCRNGFNRRDEAIKHYKTHFRNPHTTFQIQVTQEVNSRQYYLQSAEAHLKAYGGLTASAGSSSECCTIDTTLAQESVIGTATGEETLLTDRAKDSSVSNGILVGAEETVGSSQHASGREALLLMNPDGEGGSLVFEETSGIITEQGDESLLLEKQLLELHQQNQLLHQEKETMEKKLQAEIDELKTQVASLVEANVKMFEELQVYRSAEGSVQKINKLVERLVDQHRELLQTQLVTLRKEVLQDAGQPPINGHTGALHFTLGQDGEGGVRAVGDAGLQMVEVHLEQDQTEAEEAMQSPVHRDTTIYQVEMLEKRDAVLLPGKRVCEDQPEQGKNKLQRTT